MVEEKGIYSIEKFLMARRLMYWQVYLHRTVLCAEFMLMTALKRAKDLAQQGNLLMEDPEKRKRFARAGRKRAVKRFSWKSIAKQTRDLYTALKKS